MAKLGDLSEMLRQERAAMPRENSASQALAGRQDLEMTKDIAKALANKDFAKAGKSLKQLADAAAKGQLSREQKEKLEKELKEIANSLRNDKRLSAALDSLSNALTESDMANLEKALGEAMGDMDKMAEMEAELKMLQAAAGLLEDGKYGLGDQSGEGEGLGRGELRSWSGANPYSPGDENDEVGPGIGGPGRGVGGIAPVKPDDVDFSPTRIRGQLKPGRVVGSFFVNGKDLKGEAKAEYLQTVTAAQAEAAQAMQDQKVPRGYETYVRDYFHGMKSGNEEK